jgi:hypothetical protein
LGFGHRTKAQEEDEGFAHAFCDFSKCPHKSFLEKYISGKILGT